MTHQPTHDSSNPRRLRWMAALAVCLAGGILNGQPVYLAERRPDGATELKLRSGPVETTVYGLVPDAEWQRFELRTAARSSAEDRGGVLEIRGGASRLQVRSNFHLVACHSLTSDAAALVAIGPWGLRALLSSSDDRYRLESGGAFLAPGGGHIGLVLRGTTREEVVVVDLRAKAPSLSHLLVPAPVEKVEAESLVLTAAACFFVGRLEEDGFVLCRAPLEAAGGIGPITAEIIAGPHADAERALASSLGAAAWIAGAKSDSLDVFVARESGPAVNVTVTGGPVVASRSGNNRLAVADDGSAVAYNLDVGGEPEVFLHDVSTPGPAGRRQITADQWFNPYIDQEVWVFFSAAGDLVFAAGHDPVTTDVFRVNDTLSQWAVNLTGTGTVEPGPRFATKGSLRVDAIALLGDAAVISAEGLAGTGTGGIYVVDVLTGAELAARSDVSAATGFFSLGSDLYFAATLPSGEGAFHRLTISGSPPAATLLELGRTPVGSAPALLFLSPERALVSIAGTGILELRAGAEPRTVAGTAADSSSAALSSSGAYAIIARRQEDGSFAIVRVDLSTGAETVLFTDPAGRELLAAADGGVPFLRGDASGDGVRDLSDAVQALEFLFSGTRQLPCLDAADADDDGDLLITDPVRLLLFLFAGGAALPEPFLEPGSDPTPDALGECLAGGV